MDGERSENPTLFPVKVGEKLRDTRLAQGMELADIATRTRVPLRHLQAIEAGDYSGLPSPTYAIGFVKAYARAVGADEVALAQELRAETSETFAAREVYESYDPTDPVREPPGVLAWAGAAIAVLLLVGVGLWYGTDLFRSSGEPVPEPTATASAVVEPTPTPAPAAGGQVTLIATEPVWLRIYDAGGARLFEKEMAPGERYDVPANANGPMINIGRPEALQVTVNGSNVAALGPAGIALMDVPISAEALMARGTAGASATPAVAVPAPRASATPQARRLPATSPSRAANPAPPPVEAAPEPAANATGA
ncbi:helix-turn-helix domain-containing protein [Sphingomonas sp. LT1P40]|uniref:helix-turn-helix domain-containing protein n=1 Tax=Alteristakelama amylovorans TaxID=3096166 RepID=UPI002FC9CF4D